MKIKSGNKFNILLVAIVLLLVFVAGANWFGQTGSWLTDKNQIGFWLNVEGVDITVKQGGRAIDNRTGFVYLGTDLIESNTKYLTNTLQTIVDEETGEETTNGEDNSVTITNNETGVGYYIRCQVIAVVNGVSYNINRCVTTTDLTPSGKWLYNMDGENRVAMTAGQTLTIMQDVVFPKSFIEETVAGQFIKLHIFIEGSATGVFDDEITQS